MGTCVICGKDVDGKVCESHEEDVLFEFEGDSVADLVPQRYYRGSVDGFADFGVFIDLAPGVTGLLHRSEIPSRLESLDWEAGDEVFVQVTGVHDNGNVDLGWSIRQSPREFRHHLVQDPEGDREADADDEEPESSTVVRRAGGGPGIEETDQGGRADTGGGGVTGQTGVARTEDTAEGGSEAVTDDGDTTTEPDEDTSEAEDRAAVSTGAEQPDAIPIEAVADQVGNRVTLKAAVTDINQTSGPTVFTVADATGTVECAAFESAGVRAYPEVDVGDAVELVGEVERRHGDLQVETESLTILEAGERAAVHEQIEAAQAARAQPDGVELLTEDPTLESVTDDIEATAAAIRRAVMDPRPVVIRHASTVDGYVAGAAIERAILPLVGAEHEADDAVYHYVDRQPLQDPYYDVSAATDDVVSLLSAADRHDEATPLFVLVDAGGTAESADGFEFLDVYDADRVVVDGGDAEPEAVADNVDAFLTADTTSTVLATAVAATVNPEMKADLEHLPAVSFWDGVPERYRTLAADAGRDDETITALREATALAAYYHGRQSKRELITDLFWEGRDDLASYLSDQFRAKLTAELDSARPHLEIEATDGVDVAVLDAHAFTHRFDFPPVDLILDALHRERTDDADTPVATLGVDEDTLIYRTTTPVNARDLAVTVSEATPDAGVRARGTTDGRLRFLRGEGDQVVDAAVTAIADRLRE
ncbi:MAG: OB-fold nucleic acid binding domain-containing protein [Halobacteriaceae archaeon]